MTERAPSPIARPESISTPARTRRANQAAREALDAPRGAGRHRRIRRLGGGAARPAIRKPVLVSGTDGSVPSCASRSIPGVTIPWHRFGWRCASTTWSSKAPNRCFSSTTSQPASSTWAWRTPHRRHRRGVRASRLRTGGRRNSRDAGYVSWRGLRSGGLLRRRCGKGRHHRRIGHACRRRGSRTAVFGTPFQWFFADQENLAGRRC